MAPKSIIPATDKPADPYAAAPSMRPVSVVRPDGEAPDAYRNAPSMRPQSIIPPEGTPFDPYRSAPSMRPVSILPKPDTAPALALHTNEKLEEAPAAATVAPAAPAQIQATPSATPAAKPARDPNEPYAAWTGSDGIKHELYGQDARNPEKALAAIKANPQAFKAAADRAWSRAGKPMEKAAADWELPELRSNSRQL